MNIREVLVALHAFPLKATVSSISKSSEESVFKSEARNAHAWKQVNNNAEEWW
jgi:hypothetical protein